MVKRIIILTLSVIVIYFIMMGFVQFAAMVFPGSVLAVIIGGSIIGIALGFFDHLFPRMSMDF